MSGLYNVRELFIPDEGYVLLEADLGQAEARVVAALSGDTKLLKKWEDPAFDVHHYTASIALDKPEDKVSKIERNVVGKTGRHATNYAESWVALAHSINSEADTTGYTITPALAKRVLQRLHADNPGLGHFEFEKSEGTWWRKVYDAIEHDGCLTSCLGRKRTLFGRRRGKRWLDDVHKSGISFDPQATVADLLNQGMLNWWDNYEGKIGQLLMQVHDSIVTQVKLGREKLAAKVLKKCLEIPITVAGTTLVIPADVEVGENWAQMSKL